MAVVVVVVCVCGAPHMEIKAELLAAGFHLSPCLEVESFLFLMIHNLHQASKPTNIWVILLSSPCV